MTQLPTQPYLGNRFFIEISNEVVAYFNECSGLSMETEVTEYVEGGLNTYTHKLPLRVKYSNITLKRGLDTGADLYSWYTQMLRGKLVRKSISIILYGWSYGRTQVKQVEQRWDIVGAYPVKYTGPSLKSDTGAVAVESIEFAHNGLNLGSLLNARTNSRVSST